MSAPSQDIRRRGYASEPEIFSSRRQRIVLRKLWWAGLFSWRRGWNSFVAPVPAPVDEYDRLFYEHDFALQNASVPEERLDAHVDVVRGVYELLI
jgi:hypothetical protein